MLVMAGRANQSATEIRAVRLALGLSQRQFAARLGVSLESYRPWDSGRRGAPQDVLERAVAAVNGRDLADLPMSLAALAKILTISDGELTAAERNAARAGDVDEISLDL